MFHLWNMQGKLQGGNTQRQYSKHLKEGNN